MECMSRTQECCGQCTEQVALATGHLFVGLSDRLKFSVNFVIPGPPKGKGRHRSRIAKGRDGKQFVASYTPKDTVEYENLVRVAAFEAMAGRVPTTFPVRVTIRAFFPVPASWSAKRRARALAGEILPTVKPDLDNVEKAVMDGMNAIVFRDDVVACEVVKRKRYSDTPRVEVETVEMDAEAA